MDVSVPFGHLSVNYSTYFLLKSKAPGSDTSKGLDPILYCTEWFMSIYSRFAPPTSLHFCVSLLSPYCSLTVPLLSPYCPLLSPYCPLTVPYCRLTVPLLSPYCPLLSLTVPLLFLTVPYCPLTVPLLPLTVPLLSLTVPYVFMLPCDLYRTLPWPMVLRVWDMFFLEGVKVLFKVAVAVLHRAFHSEEDRKECKG